MMLQHCTLIQHNHQKKEEGAPQALPLLLNKSRPGWRSDSFRLAPSPTG